MALQTKKLFNPNGDDTKQNKKIIGGDTTNIQDFGDPKYQVFMDIYDLMLNSFWQPKEVRLQEDVRLYQNLGKEKKETFDKMISFLVFLDSLQVNNIPNLNNYITMSEVNLCLVSQAFDEAIHSQSYSYILDSIVEKNRRSEVLNQWRDNEYLLKRNKYIGNIYNQFSEYPTTHNLIRVLFGNYVLESIYFYSNFAFFYHLQRLGETNGVSQIIRMINRDELNHVVLFQNIINIVKEEQKEFFTEEFVDELREIIVEGVRQEQDWARYSIGNHIEGLNCEDVCDYITYLGNIRLKDIGLEPISNNFENPLPWIDDISQNSSVFTDFFEGRVTSYGKISSFTDDL